ncbi:hypothetical protein F5Y19DRAFT_466884 [Xylariaceae sp. FL1651]|nr:hypothetical protein F5Y19DRAFT_466884 [Xylariaceae sp. FL1651]
MCVRSAMKRCDEYFYRSYDLGVHCRRNRHAGIKCSQLGCDQRFVSWLHRKTHEAVPHVPGHHHVGGEAGFVCIECDQSFRTQGQLASHANSSKHTPFACSCGVKFARVDVLHRHIKSFSKISAQFPCTFCKRHQGKHAFRRRDHLVQHLRGYHKLESEEIDKICPSKRSLKNVQVSTCHHLGCDGYRDENFLSLPWIEQKQQRPFQKQSEYNKHMRDNHKETPFPCKVVDCDRNGAKGFLREKDLMKHLASKHPEAPQHVPEVREYLCPRCNKNLV